MVDVFLLDGMDKQTLSFARAIRSSKHKNIRLWIERSVSGNSPYSTWKDKKVIEDNVGAIQNLGFEWNISNKTVVSLSYPMQSLLWRISNQQTNFCIFTTNNQPKNQMILFEDSSSDNALPQMFKHISCFSDYDSLMNYCKEIGEISFSLNDRSFFQHEYSIQNVKGAEVYRELATGRLWYKDTLHNNHYEVFDRLGKKHLGEADLNGIFDSNKADTSKKAIA